MRRTALAFALIVPMTLAACGPNPALTATVTVISR